MARFLHVADVHLGFDRYDNKQRTQDFFYAFRDVLSKHAIDEQVDFVIIAGDLFEHRNIQPATLNQAQVCLDMLREAGIPVLAIEGNHDNRPYGTKTSWLRYLADWGLLKLLEPGNVAEGEPLYSPWSEADRRGGYIDLDCACWGHCGTERRHRERSNKLPLPFPRCRLPLAPLSCCFITALKGKLPATRERCATANCCRSSKPG
jgi:hypothetical protein